MVFMVGSCRLFSCGIPCFVLSTRLSVGTTRSLDDVVAMGNSHAANEQASMLCNSLFLEHSSIHATFPVFQDRDLPALEDWIMSVRE